MQIGIRPLLMSSRLTDTEQKIMWGDEHWARLSGSGAIAEVVDDNLYLAMSVRNSGSGVAVIHGWHLVLRELQQDTRTPSPTSSADSCETSASPATTSGSGRPRSANRDDPEYGALLEAVRGPRVFAIELLYSDHEGGQRAIGRFAVAPVKESVWLCSVVRHWNLDRPDPR
jgi:hypothetical protein